MIDALLDPGGAVEAAAACLQSGGLVVLPTETVYGIAALATDLSAVDEIFVRKGRPAGRRVAVLVADLDQAQQLAVFDHRAAAMAGVWWPGPLTMVLPSVAGSTELTVGVRCPNHELIRAIASVVGPIATTSANRSGDLTPADARAAAASLGNGLLILDGGPCTGMPSTVVDLTVDPAVMLREGAIGLADLTAAGLRMSSESAAQRGSS
ncbi:MAG: L-threonylcarbamoyladenylate synthase [Acidimicrobiales bacterium]|nr:L-threonylcarbamoyladenylate synthase [Acidimicrobiales bacterium]